MIEPAEEALPFRWDLVTPDQVGSLLQGTRTPTLWFLDELVECAAKIVARSADGDLYFVGRSLDSMFDLLSGALAGHQHVIHRLPFSFRRPVVRSTGRRWRPRPLTPGERAQARRIMATVNLTPHALARRRRPVTFVDVVAFGSTFAELFQLLHEWVGDDRESWPVIRRKLRFVGVTMRRKTSPNTYRWLQHAAWTAALPARAIVNVPMDAPVWAHLADEQTKLTRSFGPERWFADAGREREERAQRAPQSRANADRPDHDERTRQALAEALALVAYGRSDQGRRALARAMDGEPALAKAWLRTLVARLIRP
jgi:hypothetical protein